jgi:hypothetical protein
MKAVGRGEAIGLEDDLAFEVVNFIERMAVGVCLFLFVRLRGFSVHGISSLMEITGTLPEHSSGVKSAN